MYLLTWYGKRVNLTLSCHCTKKYLDTFFFTLLGVYERCILPPTVFLLSSCSLLAYTWLLLELSFLHGCFLSHSQSHPCSVKTFRLCAVSLKHPINLANSPRPEYPKRTCNFHNERPQPDARFKPRTILSVRQPPAT